MSDTKAQSPIEKVIEIVRRPHPDISGEHMEDILAIAKQAAAELAELKADDDRLARDVIQLHEANSNQGLKLIKLRAELDEARRMLNRQAEEYAAYGIQPPKDILDWLTSHPKDGVK